MTLQKKDFVKICRCCLGMEGPMLNIFELQFEETLFFEILQSLFCSEFKVDDELPRNICQQCVGKVVWYYCFKRSYARTENILLEILERSKRKKQNKNDKLSEIKLEIIYEENSLKTNGNVKNAAQCRREKQYNTDTSMMAEDCEDIEFKIKILDDTEIKSEATTDENSNNPVILDDLHEENQITAIPNPETNDNLNIPLVLDDFLQQNQSMDILNHETANQVKVPLDGRCAINANGKNGESPKKITCSCFAVFATLSEYYRHKKKEKNHHRIKYHCEICKKWFTRSSFLIHMRSHTKEKPYKCELCSSSFTAYGNLHRHKRLHTGEKPYVCEHCGKAFTQSTTLVYHRRIHTKEKPCLCASCGKSFGNPSLLNLHTRRQHKGSKLDRTRDDNNFLCSVCGKKCPSKRSLVAHEHMHNLLHNPINKTRMKKTYLCTYCGKGFASSTSFQQHTFGHTGERPYSCTYCDKKFRQATGLKVHTCTHTGEKPYICQICQKGFIQGQQLKSHLRTHSGEKPYKCKLCEKAFAHQTTYTVHVRTHTGERPYVCNGCHKGFYHSSSMKKHRKQYCKGIPGKDA